MLDTTKKAGVKKVVSKKPIKANLESDWEKVVDKGAKELSKYILKDSSAQKSITNKVVDSFNDAMDYVDAVGFKAKGVKVTGGRFDSIVDDDTLAEFGFFGNLEFTTPKELSKDDVIAVLEEASDYFQEYMGDEGHLVFEGYSPITEYESTMGTAYLAGVESMPDDDEVSVLNLPENFESVDFTGMFANYGGGFDKILKGGNGKWVVELGMVASWKFGFSPLLNFFMV